MRLGELSSSSTQRVGLTNATRRVHLVEVCAIVCCAGQAINRPCSRWCVMAYADGDGLPSLCPHMRAGQETSAEGGFRPSCHIRVVAGTALVLSISRSSLPTALTIRTVRFSPTLQRRPRRSCSSCKSTFSRVGPPDPLPSQDLPRCAEPSSERCRGGVPCAAHMKRCTSHGVRRRMRL